MRDFGLGVRENGGKKGVKSGVKNFVKKGVRQRGYSWQDTTLSHAFVHVSFHGFFTLFFTSLVVDVLLLLHHGTRVSGTR
jgi:hypothetical protein